MAGIPIDIGVRSFTCCTVFREVAWVSAIGAAFEPVRYRRDAQNVIETVNLLDDAHPALRTAR